MGGRARWAAGAGLVSLAGLLAIAGYSVSGSAPAPRPHVSLAGDRYGVSYWTYEVNADSQLIVSRDQQLANEEGDLPPCDQTPAVDPPCHGFDAATAAAMAQVIVADGQAVVDAQTQLADAQVWLQAFQRRLQHDRSRR